MPALPAIIMGGASIGGAIIGSNAAKSASKTQADAAATVGPLATAAAEKANAGIGEAKTTADSLFSPYVNAGSTTLGQLVTGLQPGGNLNTPFTAADMEKYDPGYQFRIQQGQQALERSAAARGTSLTGGTLKDLAEYEQGLASSEYTNAFNRYQQQNQQTYNMLAGVTNLGLSATGSTAGIGMNAAEAMGGNTMTAAQITGNAAVGAANAQSAGTIGAANAWSQGLSGAANAANTYLAQPQQYTLGQVASQTATLPTVPTPVPPPVTYAPPVVTDPWKSSYSLGSLMQQGYA